MDRTDLATLRAIAEMMERGLAELESKISELERIIDATDEDD